MVILLPGPMKSIAASACSAPSFSLSRPRISYCGRRGSRAGVVPVGLAHLLSPRFLWECLNRQPLGLSPAPASSHAACGFPALRGPAHFASRVMVPIVPELLSSLAIPLYSVVVEQTEFLVQPLSTPPLPAEASALAGLPLSARHKSRPPVALLQSDRTVSYRSPRSMPGLMPRPLCSGKELLPQVLHGRIKVHFFVPEGGFCAWSQQ